MTIKVDIHDGTSLTRGYASRGLDHARRMFHVSGLEDARTALNSAITEAQAAMGSTHPDDATLPLYTISVEALSSGMVIGVADYRRPTQGVDLSREAKAQTSRRTGTVSVEWWRNTTEFDADNLPNGPILFRPHNADTLVPDLHPRSFSHTIPVQVISMPTILSTHPSSTHLDKVGKLNSGDDSQFLTLGGFPAGTLLFKGWDSTYIGSGMFHVVYRVVYMKEKWPMMPPPIYNTSKEVWETIILPAYASTSFGTLPVHNVVS